MVEIHRCVVCLACRVAVDDFQVFADRAGAQHIVPLEVAFPWNAQRYLVDARGFEGDAHRRVEGEHA